MISVILAGGSGTRLWPLSTSDYPKHLLCINGKQESLLQGTYARVKKISSVVYIVTDATHAHHVREQLPEITNSTCIIEPARRGTANCVIAGLAAVAKDYPATQEAIAFVHADHYIRNSEGFAHSLQVADETARHEKRIVLVGAEPDSPATAFGYIEKGPIFDQDAYVFKVDSFKEKPNHRIAQKYVASGNYLWNCGYFVGTPQVFLKYMKNLNTEMFANYHALVTARDREQYENVYLDFASDAVDYALIEKIDDLLVVPASFDWMDLGSYGDLHKAVENDERGNHVHGTHVELEDVENCFIQTYDDKPLAVIGLDNVVVVNNQHGILVTRKDLAQKVGDVSKRFNK